MQKCRVKYRQNDVHVEVGKNTKTAVVETSKMGNYRG